MFGHVAIREPLHPAFTFYRNYFIFFVSYGVLRVSLHIIRSAKYGVYDRQKLPSVIRLPVHMYAMCRSRKRDVQV